MPSPATTSLPIPKSWDEFEDICSDVLKRLWKDPYLVRNGRSGQKQDGVDIYGQPSHLKDDLQAYAGAQCKRTDVLKIEVIEEEVEKAKRFQPCLDEYLIMTTATRDAVLQEQVRTKPWIFRIHIMFWEDISLELSGHNDLLQKYFPGWMNRTTTKEQIFNTVLSSQPSDFDYDDVAGTFFYNADVKLQVIKNRELPELEYFVYEPWLDCFANSDAISLPVSIFYGETKILEVSCVYVDSRHIIPLPKSPTNLVIDQLGYHVGCIVNYPLIKTNPTWANFDNALMRAEITVRDD